jgi:hypothetical protein
MPRCGVLPNCGWFSRASPLALAAMIEEPNEDAGVAERDALLFFLNRVRDAVVCVRLKVSLTPNSVLPVSDPEQTSWASFST